MDNQIKRTRVSTPNLNFSNKVFHPWPPRFTLRTPEQKLAHKKCETKTHVNWNESLWTLQCAAGARQWIFCDANYRQFSSKTSPALDKQPVNWSTIDVHGEKEFALLLKPKNVLSDDASTAESLKWVITQVSCSLPSPNLSYRKKPGNGRGA